MSLLARLRYGQDEAASSQFVELYAPLVYGYLRKQKLQDADAADLCQEVLGALAFPCLFRVIPWLNLRSGT